MSLTPRLPIAQQELTRTIFRSCKGQAVFFGRSASIDLCLAGYSALWIFQTRRKQ